jgi:hypothetical protein
MKEKGKKAGARPPVRVHSRPARSSDFKEGTLARWIFDKVTGPGFRARVKAAAALPVRFPGNVGILYDPAWQNDIVSDKELQEWQESRKSPASKGCCAGLALASFQVKALPVGNSQPPVVRTIVGQNPIQIDQRARI